MVELQARSATKHREPNSFHGASTAPSPSVSIANGKEDTDADAQLGAHRVLVDTQSLKLIDPLGRMDKQEATPRPKSVGKVRLAKPKLGAGGPRGGTSVPLYSGLDKETVGLEILRKLFSSDENEISDLRAQHGVGADAIDELQHYYELKVSAGTEPDHVTLTNSEVKRALTTPNFFLVVVSGIEGVEARPKVRVIVDPLNQLQPTESGSITLSGVRSATSLVYEFAHTDGSIPASGGEGLEVPVD